MTRKKKDIYDTYAYGISPLGITAYCYNEKLTSIEELVLLENLAYLEANKKKYHLFKKVENEKIALTISLN